MSASSKSFLFYRFSRKIVEIFFRLFYRLKVYGAHEHLIEGRAILAGNHVSFFDPPLIGVAWPEIIHYFARQSLFEKPVLGFLLRSYNVHPLSSEGAMGALKLFSTLLKQDYKVVIFPEGMRAKENKIEDVKQGFTMIAQKCDSPIIPVYVHGTYDVWNRYRKWPKLNGRIACVFGTPLQWSLFEGIDRKEAQIQMSRKWKESVEALKDWYLEGAKGTPP